MYNIENKIYRYVSFLSLILHKHLFINLYTYRCLNFYSLNNCFKSDSEFTILIISGLCNTYIIIKRTNTPSRKICFFTYSYFRTYGYNILYILNKLMNSIWIGYQYSKTQISVSNWSYFIVFYFLYNCLCLT